MYIWRGKNRRDRRNFVSAGTFLWGPPDGSHETSKEDERYRQAHEKEFVENYTKLIKSLILEYLTTRHGQAEIECVGMEVENWNKIIIDRERERQKDFLLKKGNGAPKSSKPSIPTESESSPAFTKPGIFGMVENASTGNKEKDIIKAIFKRFDTDGSESLDKQELKVLLNVLKVPISDDRLVKLMLELDKDLTAEIDFEEFYAWFSKEMHSKRSIWNELRSGNITGLLGGSPSLQMEGNTNFQKMVNEVEARALIIETMVYRTEVEARKEFRLVHPPLMPCEKCDFCAVTATEMHQHRWQADGIHETSDQRRLDLEEKMKIVDAAFLGAQGRRLLAHRLLFSVDLGGLANRLRVAAYEPYRPRIADPSGHREEQQRKGLLVQGYDPTAGIRAQPRQKGLYRQHRVPGALAGEQAFQEVLVAIRENLDSKEDVVYTASAAAHADVTFVWRLTCLVGVDIVGEFNGWRPQPLVGDVDTRKYSIVLSLAPGRYRYRYIVDGVTMLDPDAATVQDMPSGSSDDGKFNIIAVCNPPLDRGARRGLSRLPLEEPRRTLGSPSLPDKYCDMLPAVSGEEERQLARAFSDNRSVPGKSGGISKKPEVVALQSQGLGDDGAWTLASSLRANHVIRELNISHNAMSDDGIQAIAKAIPDLKALEVLRVSGNGFGVDGCRYLVDALVGSATILTVEAARNSLGDDAGEQLGRLIKYHRSLRELYIDGNYIGNDGIDFIGQALERNRTVRTLSISGNRIYALGAGRLAFYLRKNSALTDLRLDSNPLGPDGAQHIGAMLGTNDSIRTINLDNTEMMKGSVHHGLYAITYSLKKNRTLRSLSLRNNMITSENAAEIAFALYKNQGVTSVNLQGNQIEDQYFRLDHYMAKMGLTDLPSIATSLAHNNDIKDSPQIVSKYREPDRDVADTFEGFWTIRHRWMAVVTSSSLQKAVDEAMQREQERIEAERLEVEREVDAEKVQLEAFFQTSEGRKMLAAIAKVMNNFVHSLAAESTATSAEPNEEGHANIRNGSGNGVSGRRQGAGDRDEEASWHRLAIVTNLLKQHDCDDRFFVALERVPSILQRLAVPCSASEDVEELRAEPVAISHGKVGVRRLLRFVKHRSSKLCGKQKLERLRLLGERLVSASPLEDARLLYTDHALYTRRKEATTKYRSLPFKEPNFPCSMCRRRFATQKELQRHCGKFKEHRLFRLKRLIWQAQQQFILRAKWLMTGTLFPAFYVLNPAIRFHKDISSQVFDTRGKEGRPIGVIEPNMTVRVEDMIGEWMQVRHEDHIGWVRWRQDGSFAVLVPAMKRERGFWNDLVTFRKPLLYRVSDDLPQYAEIKVRQMPTKDGVVCGNLTPGMVIQAWAELGQWLQVRYHQFAAAWVLQTSGQHQLLLPIDELVQRKLTEDSALPMSPCVIPLRRLELAEIGSEIEEEIRGGSGAGEEYSLDTDDY